ncbi:uncharacterized protein UV8b_04774 [Ustilaginoidea virens]|uniref:C2H2-type domain-containing protein n=2 Tax=Ustilaginoidea virens TaxID=1159556 RepID=A0A8E5HS68_USTVR|nr:uncharacterized protein UV8b_04774 [Ustilaginoidea virens]QUC20533.1 hypothetical protein UV8b_04774 [Ustilaginoidea virens]
MEPSSKKRKLAPKVNASPAPNSQPSVPQYTREPSLSQGQHYAVQEAPLIERQDFESFARHLQDAAMLIQRQTERPPHNDVSVLLLSWEEDRSVDYDVLAFQQVLETKYNFSTYRWQIPTVPNPSIKLGVQMASFLENARPNHLRIVYYAGHGYVGGDGHLYWACNARDDSAKLKWDGVRCLFEDAQSDILLLLDTCAIPDPPTSGSHGIKQGIAATMPEHNALEYSARSFTASMIEAFVALQKLYKGRPFGVNRLFEEIVAQKYMRADAASVQPQLPLLFTLTPGQSRNLMLAPLPPRPDPFMQNGGDVSDDQGKRDGGDDLIDPESVSNLRFDENRILVCTTFVGDASPDMSFFQQWLQNTPPLGSRIAVEGMFLGPPTMLLISMPRSVWSIVQHDKVCCFLGYISSHNMIHLYEKMLGPGGVRPFDKKIEDGKILVQASEVGAVTPARIHGDQDTHERVYHAPGPREENFKAEGTTLLPQTSPPLLPFGVEAPEDEGEVEDTAEMQEAAEQLKALSHVQHRGNEAAPGERMRTILPDSVSEAARENARLSQGPGDNIGRDSATLMDMQVAPGSRGKGRRRSLTKQETRCSHCSHAPFRDSSSLRKHIAAAHTRPFPCAFSFAGCTSTFGSKNEWKRHIASQHLCLQFYRCSACPQATIESKGNEFNRKDLFTQHLRRMHAPFQIKRAISQGDEQLQSEWETHVKGMQQTCLVTRRQPPQKAACPKLDCRKEFDGQTAWDEWTEHVGRHMEKGEGPVLEVDGLLVQWALDEGIIEPKGDGEYRLCSSYYPLSYQSSSGPMLGRNDSIFTSLADSCQVDEVLAVGEAKLEVDEG